MNPAVTTRLDQGVAIVRIDNPPVNALSPEVISGLDAAVTAAASDPSVQAVVVIGAGRTFIAGADIEEIVAVTDPAEGEQKARLGQGIFTRIERLGVPTIAAVDGICLGGGTEMILACDFRLASDRKETRIGLPEVMLGILPASAVPRACRAWSG